MSEAIVRREKVESLIRSFLETSEEQGANLMEVSQAARCVYATACLQIDDNILDMLERRTAE